MKPVTLQMVKLALQADNGLSETDRHAILAVCRDPTLATTRVERSTTLDGFAGTVGTNNMATQVRAGDPDAGQTATVAVDQSVIANDTDCTVTVVQGAPAPMMPPEDAVLGWRDATMLKILDTAEHILVLARKGAGDAAPVRPTDDDGWMESDEVAAYLRLTPKTVREGAARGTLPGHKYPARSRRGRWLFKQDELDKFLKTPATQRREAAETVWN